MPTLQITVTANNIDALQKRLQTIGDGMLHMGPAMKIIGKSLSDYYSGVAFSAQGDLFGAEWKPLSPKYLAYKGSSKIGSRPRNGHPAKQPPLIKGQILVWSGKMKDSFGFEVAENSVVVGNSAPYFKYHQSDKERTKIPRRVMIGINESIRLLVKNEIELELGRQIHG